MRDERTGMFNRNSYDPGSDARVSRAGFSVPCHSRFKREYGNVWAPGRGRYSVFGVPMMLSVVAGEHVAALVRLAEDAYPYRV